MNTIKLERIGSPFHFKGIDKDNRIVELDASPTIGGGGNGFRPMDLLLISAAGCASIDLINILQKKRILIEDYYVEVKGSRSEDAKKKYEAIHMLFTLKISADADKSVVDEVIHSVFTKYCSVVLSLDEKILITHQLILL